jgi:hypothetical protein
VDIAAVQVNPSGQFQSFPVNQGVYTAMELRVSHDVYVLGYPLGLLDATHGMPVWKRATVATEPGGSSGAFLVDTATRAGMSGSPVFLRYRGFYKTDPESAVANPSDWFGEGDMFVGIYSGRLGASEVEAQLGVVWKARVIEEVIDGNHRASPELAE